MITSITEPPAAVEPSAAAEQLAADLRELADMIEANPAIANVSGLRWAFDRMLVSVNTKDEVVALTRAGMRTAGVKVEKHQGEKYAGVDIKFGGRLSLHVYTDREEVCERVVIGTREVTEEVPDPEALAAVPKVIVTKTVEDVKWVCSPLLAPAAGDLPQTTVEQAEAASPLNDHPDRGVCRHCAEAIGLVNGSWVGATGWRVCHPGIAGEEPGRARRHEPVTADVPAVTPMRGGAV
jgi:hypothetical protein